MNTGKQHHLPHLSQVNKRTEILPPAATIPPQQTTIDPLLHLHEVEAVVGLKKSKLYLLIQSGDFPAPVRLGRRSVRWKTSSIRLWINNLSQEVA